MAEFVTCKRIVKVYRVGQHELVALRGIDFAMDEGEFVTIVGPSGAGKSSLLNLLGGLDTPTAGQIRVGGQNLLELKGGALARYRLMGVGFVWQQIARNLLPHRSVLHNITLPMMLAGVTRRERVRRAAALLAAVGLPETAYKHPVQLSGGQQQRIAIAVALANQPPLLLADEPTGALDRDSAEQVIRLILDLRARIGLTVLMVTHDPAISAFADRVLTLRDGALGQTLTQSDADAPIVGEDGTLQLPAHAHNQLAGATRISIEIRPEGVLLRPETTSTDHSVGMRDALPPDAPPERRWFRKRDVP